MSEFTTKLYLVPAVGGYRQLQVRQLRRALGGREDQQGIVLQALHEAGGQVGRVPSRTAQQAHEPGGRLHSTQAQADAVMGVAPSLLRVAGFAGYYPACPCGCMSPAVQVE